MSKLDAVQTLWEQAKKSGQNMDDLEILLEDYKVMLNDVMASGDEYRKSLRRLYEEIPDLHRLVGKKHDAILKGRLQDAISILKKTVSVAETPPTTEAPNPEVTGTDTTELSVEEERKPFRNMPSLGMD
jgi:hypothetical protein